MRHPSLPGESWIEQIDAGDGWTFTVMLHQPPVGEISIVKVSLRDEPACIHEEGLYDMAPQEPPYEDAICETCEEED